VSALVVLAAVSEGLVAVWVVWLLLAIRRDRQELRAIAAFYRRIMAEEREKRRSSAAGP
jgi:hypothetical protein